MVLIIKAKEQDPEEMHKRFQKGYGTEHPEKIHGYRGLFYNPGNVYVSNLLGRIMVNNPEFADNVLKSLERFKSDDYGLISAFDNDENIECKWLFGGELLGRYPVGRWKQESIINGKSIKINMLEQYIKIHTYCGDTYILLDSEWDWIIREEEKI